MRQKNTCSIIASIVRRKKIHTSAPAISTIVEIISTDKIRKIVLEKITKTNSPFA